MPTVMRMHSVRTRDGVVHFGVPLVATVRRTRLGYIATALDLVFSGRTRARLLLDADSQIRRIWDTVISPEN